MKILRRNHTPRYTAADWNAWNQARALEELGELTAQWLEGTMPYQPMYGGGPAPETQTLIPYLAAYNRAGFLTNNSQPGTTPHDGWAQRAWVHGFCAAETADQIEAAILDTDLIVGSTAPGGDNHTRICVTMHNRQPHTIAGAIDAGYLIEQYRRDIPGALPTLTGAWQIEVIDPQWGRNSLLWDRLARALNVPSELKEFAA